MNVWATERVGIVDIVYTPKRRDCVAFENKFEYL